VPVKDVFCVYHNEKIGKFLDSLKEEEKEVATKTIDFIKENFPECVNVLNGKLIYKEEH